MDYYRRKKLAMDLIDALIKTRSFTKENIEIEVLRKTCLGSKFVKTYLEGLFSRDYIEESEGGIIQPKGDYDDGN